MISGCRDEQTSADGECKVIIPKFMYSLFVSLIAFCSVVCCCISTPKPFRSSRWCLDVVFVRKYRGSMICFHPQLSHKSFSQMVDLVVQIASCLQRSSRHRQRFEFPTSTVESSQCPVTQSIHADSPIEQQSSHGHSNPFRPCPAAMHRNQTSRDDWNQLHGPTRRTVWLSE